IDPPTQTVRRKGKRDSPAQGCLDGMFNHHPAKSLVTRRGYRDNRVLDPVHAKPPAVSSRVGGVRQSVHLPNDLEFAAWIAERTVFQRVGGEFVQRQA